ncbi:MAG: hypothetical protein DI588_10430 [Flavobacterium johnsoniae]|nr:MAG: hypothetical protein DI588_10430 [Flavobacterium johnsoniae]
MIKLYMLKENHYYPFGLKHEKYNSDKYEYVEISKEDGGYLIGIEPLGPQQRRSYQYKYNGKEFQDELGLNFYDYGARNYDPAIGRWMNIDNKAEKYSFISPYAYVANNPVMFIDPDGNEIFIPNIKGKNPNGAESSRQRTTVLNNLQKLTNSKLELVKTKGGYVVKEVKGGKANEGKTLGEGSSLISGLIGAKEKVSIVIGDENRADRSKNGNTAIIFDPNKNGDTIANADGTTGRPAEIGLAHELIHADENSKAKGDYDKTPVTIINPDGEKPGDKVEVQKDELIVRERENKIREEQGIILRATPIIVN